MDGAFGDVEFLARSPNRVAVLRALADEPADRWDLREATNVGRPTLDRILSDLVARGWAVRRGAEFHATPLGAFVVDEFGGLLDRVQAARAVTDLQSYLPEEAWALDVERLADATIVTSSPADPLRPVRTAVDLIGTFDLLVMLTPVMTREALEESVAAVHAGQRFDVVFSDSVVTAMRTDPELRAAAATVLDSANTTAWRYDGDVPCILWYSRTDAALGLSDDTGAPKALVHATDPVLHGWVQTTIAQYRADAVPLERSHLA